MAIKTFTTIFAIFAFINIANAKTKNEHRNSMTVKPEIFKSLKKAEPGDIDHSKSMSSDSSVTLMYKEDYSLIDQSEFKSIVMSDDYIPERYIDSNKVVRAFIFRKITELEKIHRKERQNRIAKQSALVGKKAFDFKVKDILGNKYSLKELADKVIVMNFWFIECKPCVMEIPELNKLVEKYSDKDVIFLGFAINNKRKLKDFLEKQTFNYHVVPSNMSVADLYKVNSYPTHIVIDKNSTISYYAAGFGPKTTADLESNIDSLLK